MTNAIPVELLFTIGATMVIMTAQEKKFVAVVMGCYRRVAGRINKLLRTQNRGACRS